MKNTGLSRIVAGMAFSGLLFFSGQGLAQKPGPSLPQADLLYREADSLSEAQQDSLALLKYQQARSLYIKHKILGPNLVSACQGMGILFQIDEKFDQAIDAYKESVRYQKTLQAQADTSYFYPYILIASCYNHLNQYDSAYAYFGKVEPLLARYPKTRYAQRFYNGMGYFYEVFGNYTQSINYLEKAIMTIDPDRKAAGPEHRHQVTRYVMNNSNIARCLSKLGYYRQSIDKIKGLTRYGIIPNILYLNIAAGYLQMEQPDSARMYLDKIDFNAPATVNPNITKIEYYISLGQVYRQQQQGRQALASFNKARQISLQQFGIKNNRLALAYAGKGQVYAGQHIYGQALRNYQSALQALHFNFKETDIYRNPTDLDNTGSPLLLFKVLGYKAEAFRQYHARTLELKDLEASLRTYQLAFQLSDLIRKGYDSDEAKLFFTHTVTPVYEEAIATAFQLFIHTRQQRYLEAAFVLAEQSKAAVLAESLRELEISQVPGIPADLLRQERNLKRNMAALNLKLVEEDDPARKEKYRDQQRENGIRLARTLKEFEKNKQYYQLKYDTSPITVSGIQKGLNRQTALVEYFVGKKNLFVFVVTADGFEARQLGLTEHFKRDWQVLYEALYRTAPNKRYQGDAAAYSLYRQLLAPVAASLAGKKRLIIIPDKELCYLPFEALVSGPQNSHYLLLDYAVSYAYSGKLLRQSDDHSRLAQGASILAMAPFAPDSGPETPGSRNSLLGADRLSPLYASAGEVKKIGGQTYLGADATKQLLLQQASQYDIIHLATHAKADILDPLNSFIAFYPQSSQAGSYRLYVPEIYNLQLDKLKLVVLSACETGGGSWCREKAS